MDDEWKNPHIIDTRFTWSGDKAEEFLELVKEEYGRPIPYGAVRQLIRLACIRFVEAHRKERTNNR